MRMGRPFKEPPVLEALYENNDGSSDIGTLSLGNKRNTGDRSGMARARELIVQKAAIESGEPKQGE